MGRPPKTDLIQGTLDMLILKALALGPEHGYGVLVRIRRMSEDVLKVEQGSLYPALHRLELDELIEAEWGVSENKRRAKFYHLTAEGRKHLAAEQTHWARLSAAVNRVLLTESA